MHVKSGEIMCQCKRGAYKWPVVGGCRGQLGLSHVDQFFRVIRWFLGSLRGSRGKTFLRVFDSYTPEITPMNRRHHFDHFRTVLRVQRPDPFWRNTVTRPLYPSRGGGEGHQDGGAHGQVGGPDVGGTAPGIFGWNAFAAKTDGATKHGVHRSGLSEKRLFGGQRRGVSILPWEWIPHLTLWTTKRDTLGGFLEKMPVGARGYVFTTCCHRRLFLPTCFS